MVISNYIKLIARIIKNKLAIKGIVKPYIFKLDMAITMACDGRCRYCRIWEIYKKNPEKLKTELSLDNYQELFKQLNISWLHITGGEPFLKKYLPEILISAGNDAKPMLIDLSTNGFNTCRIVKSVRKILEGLPCDFVIGVSIDGPEEIHEKNRGIKKSWEKSFGTFLKLREIKEEFSNFDVHINHVINPINLGTFDKLITKLREFGIDMSEVSIEIARNSPFFANQKIKINSDKEKIIAELINIQRMYKNSNFSFRKIFREIYVKEMISFIKTGRRNIPCYAGISSVYINPYGDVFGCSQINKNLGNIKEDSIQKILNGLKMKKWRAKYRDCQKCVSGCEGITSIIQDLPFSLIK